LDRSGQIWQKSGPISTVSAQFSGASLDRFLVDMEGAFPVVRAGTSSLEVALTDLPSQPTILVLEPAWLN
jgi:hypothetical protein